MFQRFNRPEFLLGRFFIAAMFLVGSIPFLWPIGARYEGEFLPVVTNISVDFSRKVQVDDLMGIEADVRFDKVRACRFDGLHWYSSDGRLLDVIFSGGPDRPPVTRPVGKDQNGGTWVIFGISTLREFDRSTALVEHRCHPLWQTFTRFYPPDILP